MIPFGSIKIHMGLKTHCFVKAKFRLTLASTPPPRLELEMVYGVAALTVQLDASDRRLLGKPPSQGDLAGQAARQLQA